MDSTINGSCYTVGVTSAGMAAITTEEVLRWVYLILAIISILIPLVIKIINALKDKRLTEDEANDIQAELNKAIEELKQLEEKNKDK